MLREEIEQVKQIAEEVARRIVKEEIAAEKAKYGAPDEDLAPVGAGPPEA